MTSTTDRIFPPDPPAPFAEQSAEHICQQVLGLTNARGRVAQKIAQVWKTSYAQAAGDALLSLALGRVPFWVMDVETTGQGPPRDRVIELAGVEVHGFQVARHFTTLLNPGVKIPEFIVRLTGITNQMLAAAARPEEIFPLVRQLLLRGVLVAHSASFDWRFIQHEMRLAGLSVPSSPVICTVRLARRLRPDLPDHNLDTIAQAFRLRFAGPGSSRARHRALGDALVTAQVFIRLLRMLRPLGIKTVGDLKRFQNLPYKKVRALMPGCA